MESQPERDRRSYIGGSDAAAIVGAVPEWSNALKVYAKKVADEPAPDEVETERMYWGTKQEPLVAARYAELTGRTVTPGTFRIDPEHEWRAGHDDYEITPSPKDVVKGRLYDGPGTLEIKTTTEYLGWQWNEDEPPPGPMVQLQHYLSINGNKWGSVAVLIGGNRFKHFDVERDDDFISALIEMEAEFWQRVQERNPPDPDGTEHSRKAIGRLFPKDNGAEVILGDEANAITNELIELKAERDRLDLVIAERENRIRMEIGDARVGKLQNGQHWLYYTVKATSYTVEKAAHRVLRPPSEKSKKRKRK